MENTSFTLCTWEPISDNQTSSQKASSCLCFWGHLRLAWQCWLMAKLFCPHFTMSHSLQDTHTILYPEFFPYCFLTLQSQTTSIVSIPLAMWPFNVLTLALHQGVRSFLLSIVKFYSGQKFTQVLNCHNCFEFIHAIALLCLENKM